MNDGANQEIELIVKTLRAFTNAHFKRWLHIMEKTTHIETGRLVLKAVRLEDAADIYTYVRNPNVLRYTTGTTPRGFAETEAFVRGLANKANGAFAWAIRHKGHSEVVGVVEFGVKDGCTGSVDYALSEEYWNHGIITEAVCAVLDWAFGTLPKLKSVSSSAMTANPASTRVQQKCGMQLVRHEKAKWEKFDEPVELAVCGITREEWKAANQPSERTR